jgi:hypothetical protein
MATMYITSSSSTTETGMETMSSLLENCTVMVTAARERCHAVSEDESDIDIYDTGADEDFVSRDVDEDTDADEVFEDEDSEAERDYDEYYGEYDKLYGAEDADGYWSEEYQMILEDEAYEEYRDWLKGYPETAEY